MVKDEVSCRHGKNLPDQRAGEFYYANASEYYANNG